MGLVVNKVIDQLTLGELYAQLKIEPVAGASGPVHFGGPVAPGTGFVLHSPDYREEGTVAIGGEFAMTATRDILQANSQGAGPRQYSGGAKVGCRLGARTTRCRDSSQWLAAGGRRHKSCF